MEGDSVTLHTYEILQAYEAIEWSFNDTLLASVINNNARYVDNVKFKDRLQLDIQTGDLKITNIRTTDTGLYSIRQFIDAYSSRLALFDDFLMSPYYASQKTFSVTCVNQTGVMSLSVMEGDSVTLYTDVPEIQTYDVIRWRFGKQKCPIAEISRMAGIFYTYLSYGGMIKYRLLLDGETGSLTISNTETSLSGIYEVDFTNSGGKHTMHKSINLTVDVSGESVSVMEGDSVTLQTDVTKLLEYEEIEWSFNNTRIASVFKNKVIYEDDVKFKDRLQLDIQTGDLKITNIRTTDTGLYKYDIYRVKKMHSRDTSRKTFRVLCVRGTGRKSLSVMEGDSVTLYTDVPEIQRYDAIRWRFGKQKSLIAEINKTAGIFNISDGPDGRFRGRLQLDHQTGSLTIKNIETRHSGLYEVEMRSFGKYATYKSFNVTVSGKMQTVLVIEGDSAILQIEHDKMHAEELIEWIFENTAIAKILEGSRPVYFGGIFEGRLMLNDWTGSLTIKNARTTDSGLYKLKISHKGNLIINVDVNVTVTAWPITCDSGLSSGGIAGICVCVIVLLIVAVVVIYCRITR
ncbi:uncharacterized protein si:rp71-36a1.1 isoform X1 [Puntigrus tetrazona]|uniref:uncharacterized protein si:rp71-36a1.1 isoform X1 n=1 Tax=Puntigrus tetrazona TaxID=1606681 RepID=UPI001C8AFCEC|nr:uncharacterized protein si:rp71-36a1.1 isoform X1 [Puntigrus tetrazona]